MLVCWCACVCFCGIVRFPAIKEKKEKNTFVLALQWWFCCFLNMQWRKMWKCKDNTKITCGDDENRHESLTSKTLVLLLVRSSPVDKWSYPAIAITVMTWWSLFHRCDFIWLFCSVRSVLAKQRSSWRATTLLRNNFLSAGLISSVFTWSDSLFFLRSETLVCCVFVKCEWMYLSYTQ